MCCPHVTDVPYVVSFTQQHGSKAWLGKDASAYMLLSVSWVCMSSAPMHGVLARCSQIWPSDKGHAQGLPALPVVANGRRHSARASALRCCCSECTCLRPHLFCNAPACFSSIACAHHFSCLYVNSTPARSPCRLKAATSYGLLLTGPCTADAILQVY